MSYKTKSFTFVKEGEKPEKDQKNQNRSYLDNTNYMEVRVDLKERLTSTSPSYSGPIPAQKLRANSVSRAVFSHLIPKMDFYYFHRFSWEKIHKNTRFSQSKYHIPM